MLLRPKGHQRCCTANRQHIEAGQGPSDQRWLTQTKDPRQQGIKQPLAAIDRVIEGLTRSRIRLPGIQSQREVLLPVIAPLTGQDHQFLLRDPRR